jgi:hypothetical protein
MPVRAAPGLSKLASCVQHFLQRAASASKISAFQRFSVSAFQLFSFSAFQLLPLAMPGCGFAGSECR